MCAADHAKIKGKMLEVAIDQGVLSGSGRGDIEIMESGEGGHWHGCPERVLLPIHVLRSRPQLCVLATIRNIS
jgi:hypothetical protein